MAEKSIRLKVILINRKAVRALGFAADVLEDITEDMPWRPDAKKAARALRYAVRRLAIVEDENEAT